MRTRLVAPRDLDEREIQQMFQLMLAHYDQVAEAVFRRDLMEKTWVIVLETDRIVGFSTQKILAFGEDRAVFSGDTIIAREHWGSQHLSQAFARHFFDMAERPLYWFLISKGFKTYKYLPTFFKDFYPRYDRPTPAKWKQLIDQLGEMLYPNEYDPMTGVIRYHGAKDRLKDELQDLSVRANDPHYDFFIQANPGYRQGNDLACLTLLERDNLKPGRERLLFGSQSEQAQSL